MGRAPRNGRGAGRRVLGGLVSGQPGSLLSTSNPPLHSLSPGFAHLPVLAPSISGHKQPIYYMRRSTARVVPVPRGHQATRAALVMAAGGFPAVITVARRSNKSVRGIPQLITQRLGQPVCHGVRTRPVGLPSMISAHLCRSSCRLTQEENRTGGSIEPAMLGKISDTRDRAGQDTGESRLTTAIRKASTKYTAVAVDSAYWEP